ncbi:family 78 glycoside hydrolase catalytic domain [Bifidobacterium sp. ESL0745]|uniref:family 78 glycoside hydrolase catalytic domain n=1 Tax=Bifidobacterium sp. ESL0745 TaxID=2983226 RepID=UPI0023F935C3|nr:family 78 glycoside hydrolase catalytic domain [Bifidobacterium sp. ESL0745]MDF7666104.1 family 78 glycoside hydrolase catalytic domain [Bifidobacterium sp. ESL0745]
MSNDEVACNLNENEKESSEGRDAGGTAAGIRPYGLLTGLRDDPLGIGQATPRLWWQVPIVPGVGGMQISYEIQLSQSASGFIDSGAESTGEIRSSQNHRGFAEGMTNPARKVCPSQNSCGFAGEATASTGEIHSSQSTAIAWPFEPLPARSVSFWRVRVRVGETSDKSVLSDWSKPQKVVVGPLRAEDWDGAASIWASGGMPIHSSEPGPTRAEDAVLRLRLKVLGKSASILLRSAVDCNDGFLWRLDAEHNVLQKMHLHNNHEQPIGAASVPQDIDLHDYVDLRIVAVDECVRTFINGIQIDAVDGITKDGAAYGFKMAEGESVAVKSASICLPQTQSGCDRTGLDVNGEVDTERSKRSNGNGVTGDGDQRSNDVDISNISRGGYRNVADSCDGLSDVSESSGAGKQLFGMEYHDGCAVPPYAKLVDGAMVVPEGAFGLLGDALPGDYWAFLRHEFDVPEGEIAAAYLYAAGLSPLGARQHVYRAWVNGNFAGVGSSRQAEGPAYETYDVTEFINSGTANVIAFQAWAQAGGRVQAMLDVRYADGRVVTVATGPDWQGRPGLDWMPWHGDMNETVNYFVAPREDIDARREPVGWKTVGYAGTDFRPVESFDGIDGLRADESVEIKANDLKVKPTRLAPGRWLFDTGMERSYSVRCHLNVPDDLAGTELTLRMGEELNADGSARFHLRGGIRYEDTWTLRGGEQDFEHWGYRCFRYLQIDTDERLDLSGAITFTDLVAPEPDQTASFSSSDKTLNEVWRLCANTLSESRADLYIDTPTRERMPYEADLLTHGRGEMAFARSYDLTRKTSRYLVRNPGKFTEYKFMTVQIAYQEYLETGDPDELERDFGLYEGEQGLRWLNDDGLIEKDRKTPENDDIVDWPQPAEIDGFDFTRVNTVVNAWQYGALRALAAAAEAVGRGDAAKRYDALAARMREAMNKELFDPSAGAYRDGRDTSHTAIHSSVYAAAFGIPDEVDAREVGKWLVADSRLDDTVPVSCNAVGWLIEALYRTGQPQKALDLMRSHSATSWWSMMHRWGATQTMEAWNPEIKPNTSFAHPWGVTPIVEIARWLLGVNVTDAGGSRIVVAPHPADLEHVSGSVATVRGLVSVDIHQGKRTKVQVTVPGNVVGRLEYPLAGKLLDTVSATFSADGSSASSGISGLSVKGSSLIVPLVPGVTTVCL